MTCRHPRPAMKSLLVACWLAETAEVVVNHEVGCTMPDALRMPKRLGRSIWSAGRGRTNGRV